MPVTIAKHLAIAVVFSLVQLSVYTFLLRAFDLANAGSRPMMTTLSNTFLSKFHTGMVTYVLIVLVFYGIDFYRRYREGQLHTSRLQAQLVEAQLHALKMQLHPHFLFNTLHAISTLVHKDAGAAERMIARLSDFLRLALDNAGTQEVTLKQEIEFLQKYLEIEQIRFEDRLQVDMQIAAEALEVMVPNLILQPLVENAIRHGIANRSQAGELSMSAHLQNGSLRVRICDNGPGLTTGRHSAVREGVGIANTKKRLHSLYGSRAQLSLQNRPSGGLEVVLIIPNH